MLEPDSQLAQSALAVATDLLTCSALEVALDGCCAWVALVRWASLLLSLP